MTGHLVVVEYDAAPALPSDRRWVMRKVLPPYEGEGFVIGEAFQCSLYTARRLTAWDAVEAAARGRQNRRLTAMINSARKAQP